MRGRPIWGFSAWGGFVCALLALSSAVQGSLLAGAVLAAGSLFLFAWAVWLAGGDH
jgi:hypothetical protein